MPITLITGPANAGKAELVLDAVRRERARGAEPLLVVPTRADAEHYLRELAGEGAAMGVRVERFDGLLGEAIARAGVGEPALGGLARERLLESLAARVRPGAGRGFARALGELFAELQARRVTPARFGAALARRRELDGPDATREQLGRLYGAYREELSRLGRADAEQRAASALDALRVSPSLWCSTPVAFYGFDDLTELQRDAIETLGAVVDAPVTVSLQFEPGRAAFAGRAAAFHALAPLAAEHVALRARAEHYAPAARTALSHLERSLLEPGAARVAHGAAVRLLEGGGERAELELVAREVGALLEEGFAPEEIAVLARPAGVSLPLLEEVFDAARIPLALQRRRAFADTATGAALVGLLRCVAAPGGEAGEGGEGVESGEGGDERGGADGSLADLLAYLRAPGLLEQPALADRLERDALRRGVRDAERGRALWEARHWPIDAIARVRAAQERGAGALIERAGRELQRLFAAPRRRQARVLDGEELDEAAAASVARRALGELRELARIAPELAPASARELTEVLAGLTLVSGAPPAPGMVAVLDPLALRARRVRALLVCGMQEGVFPARARPQPLLSEDERARLAEASGLRLGEREDLLASERHLLYAVLSRPTERLVLSWHSSDDDAQPTARSLFVDDVCDLFERDLLDGRARRALGEAAASGGRVAPEKGAAPEDERARTDEPLSEAGLLEGLRERPWSASALERYIACPVSWFVERVLRPGELEPDAEPLARGALAHAALRDCLEELRAETGSARVTPASLARARELLARALAERERERPLAASPDRRAAARRRLEADLDRFLAQTAASASELEPVELELGFGFASGDERGEGSELRAFELGEGVRMRGRIDRVDVGAGGEAVVYDYKGKDPPPAARWIRDGRLQVALYMLAVEQLLGLRAVGGFYQPLAGAELRARGVLDADGGVELDCVSTDVREHAELRELLAQARASALEVAAQAASGSLQARPQTCAFRGGCMYPTICRCER